MILSILFHTQTFCFRKFPKSPVGSLKRKLYTTQAAIMVALLLMYIINWMLSKHRSFAFLVGRSFAIEVAADVLVLFLTGFYMLRIPRHLKVEQKLKFQHDKARYWATVLFFLLSLITWTVEYLSRFTDTSYDSLIVFDLVNGFSTNVVSLIIVFKHFTQNTMLEALESLPESIEV